MSAPRLKYWERRMLAHPKGKLYQLEKRSRWCEQQLELLASLTGRMLADEHLIALLRAEGFQTLPTFLRNYINTSRMMGHEQRP